MSAAPSLPTGPNSAQEVVDAALAPEIPATLLEGAASRARLKGMAALIDPGAQLTDAAADVSGIVVAWSPTSARRLAAASYYLP